MKSNLNRKVFRLVRSKLFYLFEAGEVKLLSAYLLWWRAGKSQICSPHQKWSTGLLRACWINFYTICDKSQLPIYLEFYEVEVGALRYFFNYHFYWYISYFLFFYP